MKKVLFGTTALVAAAFAANAAVAKDVTVGVGGYLISGVGVGETGSESLTGDSNIDQDFHIVYDGEVHFKAKGTLDNGIGLEVRVELEAVNDGSSDSAQIDETWVKIKSSLGTVLIGNNDTALDAVAGGIGRTSGGLGGGAWDGDYDFAPGAQSTHLGDYGDTTAIHYYTPNIAGFEFGVSWSPTYDESRTTVDTNTTANNGKNAISIGASYANTFGDVDFAIGGGYFTVDVDKTAANDDDDSIEAYGGGIELGFGGFTLGGAVEIREADTGAGANIGVQNGDELTIWGVGAEYATGPWVFGLSGMVSELDAGASSTDYETYRINGSVGYELGDGVDLGLSIDYGDYDEAGTGNDDDGFGGALLLGINF